MSVGINKSENSDKNISQLYEDDFLKEAESDKRKFYCINWKDETHKMQINW
jgi:hypothetical protein